LGSPGLYDDSIALIKAAALSGFRVVVIVPLQYPGTVQLRSYNPNYPGIWASYPLSQSDPELFASWFTPILSNLEASGVVLGGLELWNEINWTAFNGDFPVPGKGRIFSYQDLRTDEEAKVVANGYRQYMLSLAALKQIRDNSTLNQVTPVISAGLSNPGAAGRSSGQLDAVAINATLTYLRNYGLDSYADMYGIHFYPSATATPAHRQADLANNALTQCGQFGVPCAVTEYGFKLASSTCPAPDAPRQALAQELLSAVSAYGTRVQRMLWFDWLGPQYGLYRCGAETGTGVIVLKSTTAAHGGAGGADLRP
jgi:hypothetical protein